jgi:hypothetical protein
MPLTSGRRISSRSPSSAGWRETSLPDLDRESVRRSGSRTVSLFLPATRTSPDERRRCRALAALFAARQRAAAGERDAARLEDDTCRDLAAAGLAVDYVEVVLPETFDRPRRVEAGAALCAAVRAGKTRLIDNVLLLDAETAEREDSRKP